jgi:antitoxin (DNA-binding transcriptional repressor) of toxin-antitoxin stability system
MMERAWRRIFMFRWVRKRRWVWGVLIGVGVVLLVVGRPVVFLIGAAWSDRDERKPLAKGWVDDVSRLNATQVEEVWDMPHGEEGIGKLKEVLARARAGKLHVSIAGAFGDCDAGE